MLRGESRAACQSGITLVELLIVVAILGLVCGFVVAQMKLMAGGLEAGTNEFVSISKLTRSYAMSSTTPHRMIPTTDTSIRIEYVLGRSKNS